MLGSAIFFLLLVVPSLAAPEGSPGVGDKVGWVPREILERPVPLREGIGRVHEAVTTSSKEAQAFYDQGLAYLHSYIWIEAARSFNQALRLDPKMAMACVGLSRAASGLDDPDASRAALERAQALQAGASDWERKRIAIRARQLEALSDLTNKARHLEYKRALDEALALYINDVELWLLRGNAEEPTAAGRGQRGGAASIAFYEAALNRSPDNFAAHHYLIHSCETIGQIDQALKHGEAYARLAPAVPHAHHMYGHDLRRVGRIEDAIARFTRAGELENAYYRAERIPPGFDWHHQHNLDLLSTAYQYLGRVKKAEELMRESYAIPAVSEYGEFNKKEWPGFLLSRGRTAEALEAARSLAAGKWPMGRLAGHVMAGHCLLAMKRLEEARSELEAAGRALRDGDRSAAVFNQQAADPYLDELRGEILLRAGQKSEADVILKEVQGKVRAVPGPDAWIQALFRLEAIASAAREAGDWDLAEYAARQMLEHDPAYAGSHYALAKVAEHRGDMAVARKEFRAAEGLWGHADADLPELSEVQEKLALAR